MKKTLLLLALTLTSCGTIDTYKSLPPEKRADFLKAQAISFLRDNEGTFKKALVLAGMEVLSQATSDDERQGVANQMYAVAVAFKSLATGQAITSVDITNTLISFGSTVPSYVKYANQAGILWEALFPKLQISGDAQLAIDYLLIFAEAAEEVGGAYKGAP